MIKRQNATGLGFHIRQTANHYAAIQTKNAHLAPALGLTHAAAGGAAAPALTLSDRLIGARLLSDHLPVVVRFNLP
jgi:hypothetical protein